MWEELKKIDIIELLILLMPLIDILNTVTNISLSLLYRGLFLAMVLFFFLFKNDSKLKKGSFCLLFVIFSFALVFSFNYYLNNGFINLFWEITTLIKFIYLPILTICLVNYYDDKNLNIKEIMLKLAWVYSLFLIIPTILGVSNLSYDYGKKGYTGLFYAPNEIGTILAILSPFVLLNLQKKEHKMGDFVLCFLFILAIFLLGTKTPVLGLIISLITILFISIIRHIIYKNNIKNIIINVCLIILSFFIYNHSYLIFNMSYQNNIYDNSNLESNINPSHGNNFYNQEELYAKDYLINFPTTSTKKDFKMLDSKLLNMIFSSRNIYMVKNLNAYKNSSTTKKIIGLSLYGESSKEFGKLVELDFIDILVNYGIAGFLVLAIALIFIIFIVFFKFLRKFKENIQDDELCSTYLSFIIAFLIALTAGHTLGAPAVSSLLALVITYLVKKYHLLKTFKLGNVILIVISSLYIVFAISYLLLPLKSKSINININVNNNKLSFANGVKLVEEEKISFNGIEDRLFYYTLNDYSHFKIIFVQRLLSTGDSLMFLTFTNEEDKNMLVNISFNDEFNNYTPVNNGLSLENEKNILLSNSYHYNNGSDEVTTFNPYVVKNFLKEEFDYHKTGNKIKKSFNIKTNTSVDTYLIVSDNQLINSDETIPYLTYNGFYTKINNYYLRDFINLKLDYQENNLNEILQENYLMSLNNYTYNYHNFWYQDYELNEEVTINHKDIYLDLNYNYNLYKNVALFDEEIYQNASNILLEEYSQNNYIKTNRGIVFNLLETTFANQMGVLNILLDYYQNHRLASVKSLIDKLLNEFVNPEWLIGDKDIHAYVTSDLSYNGTIKDCHVINNLITLKENLHEVGINKKEIDNYINILSNKFNDKC